MMSDRQQANQLSELFVSGTGSGTLPFMARNPNNVEEADPQMFMKINQDLEVEQNGITQYAGRAYKNSTIVKGNKESPKVIKHSP